MIAPAPARFAAIFGRSAATRGDSADAKGTSAPSLRLVGFLVTLAALFAVAAPVASAAGSRQLGQFCEPSGVGAAPCEPEFTEPAGMTVYQSGPEAGDVLVIDLSSHSLRRFHADGTPAPFSALSGSNEIDGKTGADKVTSGAEEILSYEEPAVASRETEVAVAPPGSPNSTEGDIYVTDSQHGRIVVFGPGGEYLSQHAIPSIPCGVAVDPSGKVFVGSYEGANAGVTKLTPAGSGALTEASHFGTATTCQVAASEGFVYAAEFGGQIHKIDSATGTTKYALGSGQNITVSIDPASGHLFTTDHSIGQVEEYDVSGTTEAKLLAITPTTSGPFGVAVEGESGRLYVSRIGHANVEVFGLRRQLGQFCEPSGVGAAPCEPEFTEPAGMTVYQSGPEAGDVLVIDLSSHSLRRFHADGTPAPFSALSGSNEIDGKTGADKVTSGAEEILSYEEPAVASRETEVAVAPPGSPNSTEGDIYVTDSQHGRIVVFGPGGEYLSQHAIPSIPCGVAVDPSGKVFVGSYEGANAGVTKLTPAGSGALTEASHFGTATTCQVAASEGFVYAAEFGGQIHKIDSATGTTKYALGSGQNITVSIDPASGHLFTTDHSIGQVEEYDVSGTTEAKLLAITPTTSGPFGVAVEGESGRLYVSRIGHANVEVFGFAPTTPEFPLTIVKAGTGSGTVKSLPPNPGINCGTECSASFEEGEEVELEATPVAGSEFTGWTTLAGNPGTCTGTTSPCKVTMTAAVELKATFDLEPTLSVTKTGSGTGAVECKFNGAGSFGACTSPHPKGTTVEARATANAGSEFVKWSSATGSAVACLNTAVPCPFTLNANSALTAEINIPGQISIETHTNGGTGSGTLECKDEGGGFESCKLSYAEGHTITLKATPDAHSIFSSLSVTGSATTTCTGAVAECTVKMESPGPVSATASFGAVAISSVVPHEGPTAGGNTVVIHGENFTGATEVKFGSVKAEPFTVEVGGTQITTTAPAEAVGTVDVMVVVPGATSATSAADHYTYVALPTVTSVVPSEGPTAGNQTVTITGTNLAAAASVKFGANPATIESDTATQIVVKSPAGSVGTVDVTATTAGGTSATSAADHYTYVALPTVTSVVPSEGPTAGNQTVTITGTNLAAAASVKFGANPATIESDTATQIVVKSPAGSVGTVDVAATTAGGTSATSAADHYTYVALPTVTSVVPSEGPTAGNQTVTITGTNLAAAASVKFGANPATIESDTATQIVVKSPAGSVGTVDVAATTAGGTSATSAADHYTYVALPTVTSVVPNEGPTAGGNSVTVHGTNLTGASFKFGANPANSVVIVSATEATMKAPACSAGTVDVTATTAGGTSATSAADHYTCVALPAVTSVSPGKGPTSGGQLVTITGTNLTGATEVKFGTTAVTCPHASSPGKCVIKSATEIEVETPSHAAATVDVTVTTPGGTSATGANDKYTFVTAPAVTEVKPTKGPATGGTEVEIVGTNLNAATKVEFGSTVVNPPFVSDTGTKLVVKSPPHGAGTVDITVTTAGGTSATSANDKFTYLGSHTLTVSTAGTGSGSVSCNGGACASSYEEGTSVTLAAAAASGSTFGGWSGAGCSGAGSCVVTVNADTTVTATFTANPPPPPPPPPAEEKCVVPKLAKKTLSKAKSALKAAKCTLGKVTKPKKSKGTLVVKSSSPGAGKTLPVNSKVNLKLGPKKKKK